MKTFKVRANQDFISTVYGNVSEGQVIGAMPEDMFNVLAGQEPPLVTDISPETVEAAKAEAKKTTKEGRGKNEAATSKADKEAGEAGGEPKEPAAVELPPAPRQRSSSQRVATTRKKAGE